MQASARFHCKWLHKYKGDVFELAVGNNQFAGQQSITIVVGLFNFCSTAHGRRDAQGGPQGQPAAAGKGRSDSGARRSPLPKPGHALPLTAPTFLGFLYPMRHALTG